MFVLLSGLKKCTNALFGVCLFLGRSNMFLGLGYSRLIIIIIFSAFVFDELVGVCFCLYSGTSI